MIDYIQYSRFVGSVTDQTTQVGRVELAVRSRGGLHLSQSVFEKGIPWRTRV